jgi:hypothetical protein
MWEPKLPGTLWATFLYLLLPIVLTTLIHTVHTDCLKTCDLLIQFNSKVVTPPQIMCNGPTNALVCNKTLIQMSHIKTLKITPTCFDHQLIIITELI